MTDTAELSCGHIVGLTDEARAIMERTAAATLRESGQAIPTLRCPRCGKVGVPTAPGGQPRQSPLVEAMRPRRSGEARPARPARPAATAAPRPAPTPPPAPDAAPVPETTPEPEPVAEPVPEPTPPPEPPPAPPGITERVVIAGGPRTGKSTLAAELARPNTMHTDDLIDVYDWSGVSAHVADEWMTQPGPWIIEGVAAIRALRKWMESNPVGTPCDVLIWLTVPHETLSPGQDRMRKGCHTVYDKIVGQLEARGVTIFVDP